jgi:endonuclease III
MADLTGLREKTMAVYQRLVEAWGYRVWKPRRDAMTELISTMLSHRTTSEQEWAAMRRLWDQYGSWAGIAAAPVEGIEAAIHGVNFPEAKAPRIKQTLQIIGERTNGTYNIDFLADTPVAEGMAWLTSLPGVGIKTASLVLLFNFHKEIMPVDTHVHRVSQRIGLIGPKTSPEQAHHDLLQLLPPDSDIYYNYHVSMITHGRKVCTWANPKCPQCVVNSLCNYYHEQFLKNPKNSRQMA